MMQPSDYPLGDGPSYAHDIEPLEAELRLAAERPDLGIDAMAVWRALEEARADYRLNQAVAAAGTWQPEDRP